MDFNVKVHKKFIDKISDSMLQLAFKNYYFWSLVWCRRKILSIWKSIALHFPTTGLYEDFLCVLQPEQQIEAHRMQKQI